MGCGTSQPVAVNHSKVEHQNKPARVDHGGSSSAPGKTETVLQPANISTEVNGSDSSKSNKQSKKQQRNKSKNPPLNSLLLGAGESGKSTVFKQMRLSYGDAFNDFERDQFAKLIWVDTLRNMNLIIAHMEKTGQLIELLDDAQLDRCITLIRSLDITRKDLADQEQDAEARKFLGEHVKADAESPPDEAVKATEVDRHRPGSKAKSSQHVFDIRRLDLAQAVHDLYSRVPEIRELLADPTNLQLEPNAEYFISKALSFANPDYLASDDDILRARIKTVSVNEAIFDVKGNPLRVVDVGGQRSERRKWAHSCENVSCIMFVSALSEFDQVLVEDERVNRLRESMEVFRQTVESKYFSGKPVALFLNKMDILESKLQRVSFKKYFPEFQGDEKNVTEVAKFVEEEFRLRLKRKNLLYTYRTSATDRYTMKFVVTAVTDMMFMEGMLWSGLL